MIGTSKAKTFNKNLTDGHTDTYFATNKQQQKLPESKKSSEWFAKNVDYFIDNSIEFASYYDKLRKLYRIAQGILNEDEYKYITEPHEGFNSDKRSFPARLRNYDIISPILNLLRGEKALRPFPYQVYVHNHDAETEMKKAQNDAVAQSLMDKVLFDMQQAGIPVNGPEGPPPPPADVAKKIKSSWSDKRAAMGQDALNFLMDDQEVKDKWKDGFYDWMVTDYVFSYKDVIRDNVEYEIVPPYEVSYVGSRETKYIEDCEAVVRRKLMTVSDIIDRFYDVLTNEEIDILEEDNKHHEHKTWNLFEDDSAYDDRNQKTTSTEKEVFHVTWKSLVKRGRLETSDIFGNEMEYEVDEHFKPRPDERVTWYWVNQVMEGYRIDGRFYKELRPIPHQRGTMDNPSKCKLPYNGLCYSPKHVRSVSMVEKMIPYQILYNIVKFRLEVTMAKNKDKITPFPVGLVPDREGWDLFTSMYYADATGYMFYDETNKNAIQAMQYMKVLDGSLNQYISFVHEYLKAIKEDLEEFVGVTRQRKGQTSASEGVSAAQQSIFQSSVITEELFSSFEEFQRRELQGMVDISKVAWIKGKRSQYVGDDMKIQFMNIDPALYAESEFGVFVRTSKQEQEKLEQLRGMAQAFAQNQMRPSMVADILNAENFLELKGRLTEMEELEMQMQQQREQGPAQAEQAKAEFDAQEKQKDRTHETVENEKDRNLEREKMLNETNAALFASDINDNGVSDALEVNKLNMEMQDKQATQNIKQQEVEVKKEQNKLKNKEIESKERIEKKKAETALKNPVAGEKPKK
jgi:hypothetical protein